MYTPATLSMPDDAEPRAVEVSAGHAATNPMTANVVMKTSKESSSGKNMSQYESSAPSGR